MHKHKKLLLLHNIVSSNGVYKIKCFFQHHLSEFEKNKVLFCSETEANRRWKISEKVDFAYDILPSRKIQFTGNDLFTYFINFSIWSELNKYNPDWIVICGWDQFAYQIAFVWGWIHKKRITLWSGSTVYENSWRRTITMPIVRFFIAISSDFVVYGTRAKDYLISLGAGNKKIVIEQNDVNGEYFKSMAEKFKKSKIKIKKELKIATPHNYLYVGQFIERKGIFDLIKAYEQVRSKEWGLILVGYGKQEGDIKNYIEKHKIKNVFVVGGWEQYDLPKIYTCSDILVLPSKEEVWGLVVNEALYSGLKVVVGDRCGCAPDLVINGKNGYTFHSGDINDLKNKLILTSRI